jgi:arabinose-5-phosphate isomerase
MHAAEALHGDLGVLLNNDVVLCISNSGNSSEIKILIPFIKARGNKIIAIVGNSGSFLAKNADFIIDSKVEAEACSFISAPTCSTTVQLGIGDAIAVSLIHAKSFTNEDFVKSHPGGSIGKKLSLKVSELAMNNQKPMVEKSANLQKIIYEISSKRIGATAVCEAQKVLGIITDGDIRRMLENNTDLSQITARDIMGKSPKTIQKNTLAIEAFRTMNQNNITQIIVLDEQEHYFGIVHLHDLVSEGLTEE